MVERRRIEVPDPGPGARLLAIAAWVVLGVLVLGLGWLSLRACSLAGLFPALSAGYCNAEVTYGISQGDHSRARITELRREVSQMEQQLALAPACQSGTIGDLNCPQPNPTKVAIVIDASASMQRCASFSASDEQKLRELYDNAYRAANAGNGEEATRLIRQAEGIETATNCQSPARRFDLAQRALEGFVGTARAGTVISAATLGTCDAPAPDLGRFEEGDRGRLIDAIRGLSPDARTPLTATIDAMAERIDGGLSADDPVNIVLISDGGDNCGAGNACEAARRLKARRPHAVINVITVGGYPYVGLCIAEATGGNVYDARDAGRLARALRQASGEAVPDGCPQPGVNQR